MPRRAAAIETFIKSSIEDYASFIEEAYGQRPQIERLTFTAKRTDGRHRWTGRAVVSHGWKVSFMGVTKQFEHIDHRSVAWMVRIAGGAA